MRSSIILTFSFLSVLFAQIQQGSDIDGEAESDESGKSVSLNSVGDRVAIGATANDGSGSSSGHVRIYEYSSGSWSQLGSDIDGEAAVDVSGGSVSLNSAGDRVAIGATGNDGSGTKSGHVRIYEYSSGSWSQLGSDIDGEATTNLSGGSVSLNSAGDRVAIGATENDGSGPKSGHVRIYEYSSGSWSQLGSDIDGESANDYSGRSVSLNSTGDRVAIGATGNDGSGESSGHVRIYEYSSGSWSKLGSDIDGEAVKDRSGVSVSLNSAGDRVAIGANGTDGIGDEKGYVRVYQYSSGSWSKLGSDIDGETADDHSGGSVSLNSVGDRVAIGATENDGSGSSSGHVRIYEYSSGNWSQQGSDIDGEAAADFSGVSVSLDSTGGRVAIGAYGNDGSGYNFGHVRIYAFRPKISSVSLASDNSTLAVTMSHAVYNTNGGSGALEASDFAFSISGGVATLSSSTPTSISASGNVYTLGIGLSGTPSGRETLTVVPVANSIYAASGIAVSTSQSNNTKTLNSITMTIATNLGISPQVTTLAGSGTSDGYVNGTGGAASFNNPIGIAVDGSSNVYVADKNNHLIRKITSAGVVTTFAGSGSAGSADGTGTGATFNSPRGVAVDGSGGNLYVGDSQNNLIRKITSTGVVTTLAGSGSSGSANGAGTGATFNSPRGVAVDGSGNVYVADRDNNLIRKITSAGVVTTLACSGSSGSANGTGTAATFNNPNGVAVDVSGNVYVADGDNNLIRKITSAGVVTTLAGSGSRGSENGTGTAASFFFPYGVAVDVSGNVYVADGENHIIRKITSAGVVTTLAGSGETKNTNTDSYINGIGTAATFNSPHGVAVDAFNVYVADRNYHRIRKITTTLASGSTTNDATLPLIFASSEATTDFAVGDITVTNGALSDFSATSSTVYTATFTPTASGAATIDVAANTFTEAASNNNTAATQFNWTYDGTAPTITITAAKGTDGFTSNDATLSLTFTSSKPTTDFAVGDITVTNGALSDFSATSSTVYTATFTPTASGAATIDVAANTFTDAFGNNNTAADQFNWTYDGTAPTVSGVTSTTANGAYIVGDAISIIVGLSEVVTVTGAPRIQLETGTTDQYASYASGTGNDTLTFTYTVASGDTTADLDYTSTSALELNSGTIKDASGNVATLTLATPGESGSLSANKNIFIDAVGPTVSTVSSTKADAAYKVGESIPINVNFDDKVYVTGTPQLTLETGTTDAVVDYSSGSGSITLTFNYTVASTHNSSDLDYTSTNALALNSGTVKDSLGNAASLTLEEIGYSGSLGANKAIIIDTSPPTVTLDPADGSMAVLPTLPISINFNEYVRLTDNTEATSTNVDALITLKDTDVNGTDIPFDATINTAKTVITIDPTADFSSEQTVYFAISASLEDSLDHGTSAASATLKMKDVIIPTVTFDPTNGSSDIPGNRNITLTFSEPIRNIDNSEITDSNIDGLIDLKGNNASGADFNYGATINAEKTFITVDPLFDFSASSVVYVGIGAVVEDDADNAIVASSTLFITGIPDVIGPAVSNVTSANADSSYKDGSSIVITVSFDEAAIVTGTPQLTLETGTTDGVANYSSGSGTKDLYFTYNVTSDHNIAHLDYESSNALTKNDGTIKDFVGNSANLALPNPGAENSLGANKTIVIDHFIPVISLVAEGTLTGEDKDYQTVATTMDISWAGTDTISGLSKYEYALGTTSGGAEVKTWTNAATVTSVSLSDLSLSDGSKYYASVKATDKADNVSNVKTGDGITIDVTAPTTGTVNDGTGEDIATISSTTTLSANWTGFSDANSGIANYEYAIGTTLGGKDTKDWTSNGLETTFTLTNLTLTYTNTYFVSVRANDNAGNVSNIATSSGAVVDLYPGPPSITAASIESNSTLPVLTNTKVNFTISEPVTAATSKVTSNLGDTVLGTLSIEEPTKISVDLAAPFTSGDEITVTIDTLTDQLGNITNNLVYNYNIALIADYNVDGSIDAADLTVLINGWTSKDYAFELGPAAGDVPNLKPATDGKYDIMDAAVLIRMWHWNLNKSGKMLSRYINLGKELAYINENNTLSIQVSKDVNAVDFYFDYPQNKVSIKQSQGHQSDKEIMLTHLDTLNGKFIMTAGYLEQKLQSIEVPYIIDGREDVTITAIYRMFDTNGEVISQGTKEITLKPVPQEFALHQNYPNPFNPVTTINYDLPQQTYVNLMIYDILGREVVKLVSEEIPAGYQSIIWNTRNSFGQPVSAGIYFYQIQTKDFVKTRKMVLLK